MLILWEIYQPRYGEKGKFLVTPNDVELPNAHFEYLVEVETAPENALFVENAIAAMYWVNCPPMNQRLI